MRISVVLCTFNRCTILPKVLDSLAAQLFSEAVSWEVIVVDNNSNDQTRAIVEVYCEKYPARYRYVFEQQQGLSRARNTGIRVAQGEIIAFIDDDVIAERTWLQSLTGSFDDVQWAGAGGRVAPPMDFRPPYWLTIGGEMDLGGALALFDLGDLPIEMKRAPYGANMAFRKTMFDKHGTFRVDLGRCGTSLLSGEDTEFGKRLMAADERLRYEPSAVVHHPVPAERLSKMYFRRWWFDFGRTRIIERGARPPILGIPREAGSVLNILWHFLPIRILQWLLSRKPQDRFYKECQVWLTVGELVQNIRRVFVLRPAPKRIQSASVGQE
jgi:glycosyltransferase involved in cell wall biosynthesis